MVNLQIIYEQLE